MRANPHTEGDPSDDLYRGDNFVRHTGDAVHFDEVNQFAWQSRQINGQKSDGIHLQSNPTMTELAFKEFNSKKSSVQNTFKANLMERYGQQQCVSNETEMELLYGQSESYREFGADGRVIKGQQELIPSSKYEEDKHPGNHSAVWGSWFDLKTLKWGYACCRCTTFHAYCTGNEGIKAMNRREENGQNGKGVQDEKGRLPKMSTIGVSMKPKEMEDADKLVNPSGYISTRGIMAAKGIARKNQKQQELERERARRLKKRARKKKKKMKKKQLGKRTIDEMDGNEADREELDEQSEEPPHKKAKQSEMYDVD